MSALNEQLRAAEEIANREPEEEEESDAWDDGPTPSEIANPF